MRGSLAASVDLADVMYKHVKSGADVTAVCTNYTPEGEHHRFIVGEDGFAKEIMLRRVGPGEGVATLEIYVMSKETLLGIIDRCDNALNHKFHRDGLGGPPRRGRQDKRLYARGLCGRGAQRSTAISRPTWICSTARSAPSSSPRAAPCAPRAAATSPPTTARDAVSRNSLVADGCMIEGTVENSVIFRGRPRRARRGREELHHHAGHRHRGRREPQLHHRRQGLRGSRRTSPSPARRSSVGTSQGQQSVI